MDFPIATQVLTMDFSVATQILKIDYSIIKLEGSITYLKSCLIRWSEATKHQTPCSGLSTLVYFVEHLHINEL